MTKLKSQIPAPPDGLRKMNLEHSHGVLLTWLMQVARDCGLPAVEYVLGPGWPGSSAQRAMISEDHADVARNEAKQLAHETSFKDRIAAGTWGI